MWVVILLEELLNRQLKNSTLNIIEINKSLESFDVVLSLLFNNVYYKIACSIKKTYSLINRNYNYFDVEVYGIEEVDNSYSDILMYDRDLVHMLEEYISTNISINLLTD